MTALAGVSCIGYARVSSEKQAGETQTSLADQQRAIDALAAKRGLVVGRWYRDEGASGATVQKRPALRALLADCEASPRPLARPGYVLVLNDSRWGRFPNPDQGAALRYRLEEAGWLVRYAEADDSENVTIRHVMRAIGGAQASEYRAQVQRNAKRGSRGTAAQGFWGSRTPYGFRRSVVYPPGRTRVLAPGQRKAPDEKVVLVPVEPEATVVREVYARYATGTESLASLTLWLRERDPARRWTRAAVRFTLANPAYVGDVVSGRVPSDRTERATTPQRSEAEWVTHPNAHPAIVTRPVFLACQEVLARNGRWTSRVRANWLVSGLVHCPCGQPYVAGGSNRNARHRMTSSYRCVTKAGLVADRCGYPGSVKKEWLESAVVATIASVVGAPAQRKRLLAHLDRALAEVRSATPEHATRLDQQIGEARAARDRLVAAVADGTLQGDEAKDRLAAVRRLLGRLEGQREALSLDQTSQRALDAERDRVAAVALDFRRAATLLTGPALRELIRPWIAGATFDPRDRTLTLDIRHIPALSYGDLPQMACRPPQDYSAVIRRKVAVGAPSSRSTGR
jgi:DNA invertase Pin-like site-specific DNA recombinase